MIKGLLILDAKSIHLIFVTVTPSEVSFDAVSFVYSKTFFFSQQRMSFSFVSNNPVLQNITDYLVEEGSFEEDELLG